MMRNKTNSLKKGISHGILIIVAFTTIFPFYWMVKTSFMTDSQAVQIPPKIIAWPPYLGNYPKVFEMAPMTAAIFNSLFIAGISTVGVLFFCSLAAFAFSKLQFKLSKQLFGIIFTTMLIPSQVTLIPLYMIFSKVGWIDTHLPLIVPQVMVNAYGVFLIRQFMATIPDSYIEAAKLDGAGYFKIYWQLMLPLCKSALITLGMFTFVGNWNNFIGPLIYLNSEDKFTIPLIVNSFRTTYYVNWGLLMTASTLAILPLFVIYFFVQRSFVEGIATTGVKG